VLLSKHPSVDGKNVAVTIAEAGLARKRTGPVMYPPPRAGRGRQLLELGDETWLIGERAMNGVRTGREPRH